MLDWIISRTNDLAAYLRGLPLPGLIAALFLLSGLLAMVFGPANNKGGKP